jgi:hypothetical protein
MKSHHAILLIGSLLLVTTPSLCAGSWLSKPFKDVNMPLTKASSWVSKQSGIAKQEIKTEDEPAKIRETATSAIDAANETVQKALADQKRLIDDANAKLDTREKIFSASVVGLFFSNGLTIYGLFAGRRRSKEELRGLELENEKKEIELQELKERLHRGTPEA